MPKPFNLCYFGDCRESMRAMIALGVKVSTVVTSPPYWGLRDYNAEGQLGLEKSPEEFLDNMVEVFRLVRDLLTDDGTLWLNMGDSYFGSWGGYNPGGDYLGQRGKIAESYSRPAYKDAGLRRPPTSLMHEVLKPKDMVGMPWRLALALQADGWWLRMDNIWHKRNPMPESTEDRPTKSHEYLFLMSKSARYFYDNEAVKEPLSDASIQRLLQPGFDDQAGGAKDYGRDSNRSARKTVENLKKRLIGTGVGFGHGYEQNPKPRQQRPAGWATGSDHSAVGWAKEQAQGRKSGNKARKPPAARGAAAENTGNVCGSVPWEGALRNKRSVWTVEDNLGLAQWLMAQDNGRELLQAYLQEARDKKSVFTVNTFAFSEAHFATFPPKLVEPCILAGTSSHGCCSQCGKGWVRIREKTFIPQEDVKTPEKLARGSNKGLDSSRRDGNLPRGRSEVKTTGWQPTCDCEGVAVIPCTVFDPFLGSGTTAEVAQAFGRRWLGCELNPDYGKMQDKRTKLMGLPL